MGGVKPPPSFNMYLFLLSTLFLNHDHQSQSQFSDFPMTTVWQNYTEIMDISWTNCGQKKLPQNLRQITSLEKARSPLPIYDFSLLAHPSW